MTQALQLDRLEDEANKATARLCQSERGREAMKTLLAMLDDGAISLDHQNQLALTALLLAAFARPGTTLNAMRDALAVDSPRT
jgi:hypothetical protein